MIKLNLISPSQQGYLDKSRRFRDVENILGLMVLTVILIAIVLIPFSSSTALLDEEINYYRKKTTANNQLLANKISSLNSRIDMLHSIQEENYNWPTLLVILTDLTPENVAILEFSAQTRDKQFNLLGFAKDRDSYLEFRSNLEASDNFFNLDFPLSDILKKEDITFKIKGSVK